MALDPLVIEFHEDQRGPIVERMVPMAAEGRGWLNVSPGLDVEPEQAPPPRSALGSIFSGRGPTVPLGTWTPAQRRDPATVGIEHGEGPKAVHMLAEWGAPVPEGWRVMQDHPKRGLVVAPPPATSADDLDAVLAWLLRAAGALCSWPRTGEWRALCYLP
jgi:hypothetical protein